MLGLLGNGTAILLITRLLHSEGTHRPSMAADLIVTCDPLPLYTPDSEIRSRVRLVMEIAGSSRIVAADEISVLHLTSSGQASSVTVIVGRSQDLSDNALVGLVVERCYFSGGTRSIGWGLRYSPEAQAQWNRSVGNARIPPLLDDSNLALRMALGYLSFATGRLLLATNDSSVLVPAIGTATVVIETASGWLVSGTAKFDGERRFSIRMSRSGKVEYASM